MYQCLWHSVRKPWGSALVNEVCAGNQLLLLTSFSIYSGFDSAEVNLTFCSELGCHRVRFVWKLRGDTARTANPN